MVSTIFHPSSPSRGLHRALSRMPPLPTDVPGLERVAGLLQDELGLADPRRRLRLLTDSLQHESLGVRCGCLEVAVG
jgi:hypothetical protein